MAKPEEKLPPGVQLNHTYIPYQQGQVYTHPKVGDQISKSIKKPAKAYGWEDEDDSEKEQKLSKEFVPRKPFSISKPETKESSSFPFMSGKKPSPEKTPVVATLPPPKVTEKPIKNEGLQKEPAGLLEKRVMSDYLQPGGASSRLSKDEKANFLFKVNNLSKPIIASCIIDCWKMSEESSRISKSLIYLEALWESDQPEWKDLFQSSIQKLKDIQTVEKFKGIASKISYSILLLSGQKPSKPLPAQSKPNNIIANPSDILSLTGFDEEKKFEAFDFDNPNKDKKVEPPKEEVKGHSPGSNKKPNAFEFMKAPPVKPVVPEKIIEKEGNLFSQMEIKIPHKEKDTNQIGDLLNSEKGVASDVSAFSFMAKPHENKEEQKAKGITIQELQKNLKDMYKEEENTVLIINKPFDGPFGESHNNEGSSTRDYYGNEKVLKREPEKNIAKKPEKKEIDKHFAFIEEQFK